MIRLQKKSAVLILLVAFLSGCDEAEKIGKLGEHFKALERIRQSVAGLLFYKEEEVSRTLRLLLPAIARARELDIAFYGKKPESEKEAGQLLDQAQAINAETYPKFQEVRARFQHYRSLNQRGWRALVGKADRGRLSEEEVAFAQEYSTVALLEMLAAAYQREVEYLYLGGARLASVAFETPLSKYDKLQLREWYRGHSVEFSKDQGLTPYEQFVKDAKEMKDVNGHLRRVGEVGDQLNEFLSSQGDRLEDAYEDYLEAYKAR